MSAWRWYHQMSQSTRAAKSVPLPGYDLWSGSIFLALPHFVIWTWKATQLVFYVSEFLVKTSLASAAASLLVGWIHEERSLFFSQNLLDKPCHVPAYQLLTQPFLSESWLCHKQVALFCLINCPLVCVLHFGFLSWLSGSPCQFPCKAGCSRVSLIQFYSSLASYPGTSILPCVIRWIYR